VHTLTYFVLYLHTVLTPLRYSYCILILYSYCIRILYSYCTHTVYSYCILILHTHTAYSYYTHTAYAYCTHTVLILYSYCILILHTHTVYSYCTPTVYSSCTHTAYSYCLLVLHTHCILILHTAYSYCILILYSYRILILYVQVIDYQNQLWRCLKWTANAYAIRMVSTWLSERRKQLETGDGDSDDLPEVTQSRPSVTFSTWLIPCASLTRSRCMLLVPASSPFALSSLPMASRIYDAAAVATATSCRQVLPRWRQITRCDSAQPSRVPD
jgi:hypothetical protein